MNKMELIKRIKAMIDRLNSPLLERDRHEGWTDDSRNSMRKFFIQMEVDLRSDRPLKEFPQYLSITRALDFWGVSGGDLLEESSRISFIYRNLASAEQT